MKSKIKKAGTILLAISFSDDLAAQTKDASQDPNIESNIRGFLKVVNSGTGKPIEQLPVKEGRAVLSGLQSSVKVDLSGVTVTEKTIVVEG